MPFEERNAWAAILSGVITYLVFGRTIWVKTAQGTYNTADGLAAWAWDVIWLIGGGIAITIAVVIAFQVLYAIVTGTPSPQLLSDERDLMINRRGAVITLLVASAGFLLAVVLLALGWSALAALNTILLGMALGALGADLHRIAVYRFGL